MDPEKILVIQLRRVGDAVFTLPVIGALKKRFPGAAIDFLVEKPADQLVRLNPFLNETLVYDKSRPVAWIERIRGRRYDWVLDFHANGRTLMLTFLSGAPVRAGFKGPVTRSIVYNRTTAASPHKYIVEQKLDLLRALGVEADSWSWDLDLPPEAVQRTEDFLKRTGLRQGGRRIIGIAPASRRETRAWLPERFGEVTGRLVQAGHSVLFLIGRGEQGLAEAIIRGSGVRELGMETAVACMDPESSLLELAAGIQCCSLVLASENGPKNIAVALGIPTVTVYGPTNPRTFDPHGDPMHRIVRDDALFCIGCGLNRCPYRHECMRNVTADRVLETLTGVLEKI